jgi:hypothetical protein
LWPWYDFPLSLLQSSDSRDDLFAKDFETRDGIYFAIKLANPHNAGEVADIVIVEDENAGRVVIATVFPMITRIGVALVAGW